MRKHLSNQQYRLRLTPIHPEIDARSYPVYRDQGPWCNRGIDAVSCPRSKDLKKIHTAALRTLTVRVLCMVLTARPCLFPRPRPLHRIDLAAGDLPIYRVVCNAILITDAFVPRISLVLNFSSTIFCQTIQNTMFLSFIDYSRAIDNKIWGIFEFYALQCVGGLPIFRVLSRPIWLWITSIVLVGGEYEGTGASRTKGRLVTALFQRSELVLGLRARAHIRCTT